MGRGRAVSLRLGPRVNICVVATGRPFDDARVVANIVALQWAGNTVSIVCAGRSQPDDTEIVVRVPSRVPTGGGKLRRFTRRMQPVRFQKWFLNRRLLSEVVERQPDIIYPVGTRATMVAVGAAKRCGAAVARDPRSTPLVPVDLIELAPASKVLSSSPSGEGLGRHTPDDGRPGWAPEPGRHSGTSVVVVFRHSEASPGNYLRNALVRAGVDTTHVERLDWAAVTPETSCVVFIESLLPAAEVVGSNPGVPVLLWAHHGEHHTDTHLNLILKYGVHAVLLAHSWHLAHRYPVPMYRFPFAVPPELMDGGKPWNERSYDVAFVGAMGPPTGSTYAKRRRMLEALESALPKGRTRFVEGVPPAELAAIYGDARVVVNEGGLRHYPITMRVFEAVGSGAALVTEPTPGLSMLLDPDSEYVEMDIEDVVRVVGDLVDSPRGPEIAAAALEHARERHTYDHRVDELFEIVSDIDRPLSTPSPPTIDISPVSKAVVEQSEIHTVAAWRSPGIVGELALHAVWVEPEEGSRRYDAVVIGEGTPGARIPGAISDAVRYVLVAAGTSEARDVARVLAVRRNVVPIVSHEGVATFDLGAKGYRIRRGPEGRGGVAVKPIAEQQENALDAGIETDDRPRVQYIGLAGHSNLGDDVMLEAVRALMPAIHIGTDVRLPDAVMLGGGTLFNAGGYYLNRIRRVDSGIGKRFVFGTGMRNPTFWNTTETFQEWEGFLSRSLSVGVRGPDSLESLRAWGFTGSADIIGDPALAVDRPGDVERIEGQIVISALDTEGQCWGGDDEVVYREILRVIGALRSRGHTAVLLTASPADDRWAAEIMRELGTAGISYLAGYRDIAASLRVIAQSDLVIGERLHAVVLAAAMGTPFAAIEYRPKVMDFCASIGARSLAIRTDQIEGLLSLVSDQLGAPITHQAHVQELRDRLKARASEISDALSLPR